MPARAIRTSASVGVWSGVVNALDAHVLGTVEDSSFHVLTPNKKATTKTMRIACAAGARGDPWTQC